MNTSDPRAGTVSVTPWTDAPVRSTSATAPRFVAVVSGVSEEALLAARIIDQARNGGLPVLLLGAAAAPDEETALRRDLVTVKAFIEGQGQSVELKMASGRGWLEQIKAECRPVDQVACYEEESAGTPRDPLSDVLARRLQIPILDFSALREAPEGRTSILSQAGAWLGSIAAIAGFLLLQARIITEMQGAVQSTALVLTLIPEVAVIWFWNSLWG